MPIFQDDLGGDRGTLPTKQTTPPLSNSPLPENKMRRKISEESIRTELCEGPLLDSPPEERVLPNGQLNTTYKFPLLGTSDRSELIQRLKRGESPTWLPNRNVGAQNIFVDSYNPLRQTSTLTSLSWNPSCRTTTRLLYRDLPLPRALRLCFPLPRFHRHDNPRMS